MDNTYIETMDLELVAGRSFEERFVTDTLNYLINEVSAGKMGFTPEEAVGQTITLWGDRTGKIIGVMKDFNFYSSHTEIRPLLLIHDPDWYTYITVRAHGDRIGEAVSAMEKIYQDFAPAYPFEYAFVEDDWADFYQTEERTGQLFNAFAIISIVIASLGLFGLSAFAIQQRTKEIGVRKVLGATIQSIVQLVSRDFVILVLLAAVIGSPLAWLAMSEWLDQFAFRIELNWLIPLASLGGVLLIAVLTIFYHSIRAARSNPVDSLRYE